MTRTFSRFVIGLGLVSCLLLVLTMPVRGQSGARTGEWRTYGGDLRQTRYSPLDQIDADNFSKLEVAWRFKTDNLGPRPEFNLQTTPLMVGGVLYATAGTRRSVIALNAGTGELLWKFSLDEGKRGEAAPRQLSGRGVAYWTNGKEERILYVTPGYQLVALDAKIGRPVPTFGRNGIVDLKLQNDQEMDLVTGEIGLHAAPVVSGNTIVIGAAHLSGAAPKSRRNQKGYVRAFDVVTGKRLWIFHTIPRLGEFGIDTWENESWSYTGNAGVWAHMAIDEELGLVYLPVEDATGDYYGGHRPGANLFSSGLVALDLRTGQRKWHYQFIHHDIWDWDIPCAPILADITVNGRQIRAIAQPTKQSWVYVLDRATGQPVWPIEERPVPKGDIPTEWYSPTQRFPTRPPAFDRQGVTLDDLIDFTPELKAEAVKIASRYKIGPIFTPAVVSRFEGPLGTLMLPSAGGGANWPGGSYDPDTGILYVYSTTTVTPLGLINDPKRSDMDYIRGVAPNPKAPPPATAGGGGGGDEGGGTVTVQGLPLIKPPYGRITAIDLNKGEIVWQIAHGETPDNIRNHPALKGLTIPRTGRQGRLGTLTTKTLVIAGEGGFFTLPDGRRGAMLRAYDKATGQERGAMYMPAPQTGSPMTYMLDGRQHIIVAIGGGNYSSELLALRLPRE
ncbi:MAG: quinoprotein glucose dehydrogenase [Acidobacteria bacterium RIFCSPLOWO2_02_FULL_68_18]|nr:MAG: quinoprotein glucose dehydrogenase [Acidobacteria bacterium RIFCSPLOWO2_02_FULL_68_18]OFW50519.1 MAG: quinoprotein glucose dehydrogenase [Acidobacteria bacterium RIFCSPLOWO2_12_FULL_68_19]